jgi:hypothetical protein
VAAAAELDEAAAAELDEAAAAEPEPAMEEALGQMEAEVAPPAPGAATLHAPFARAPQRIDSAWRLCARGAGR